MRPRSKALIFYVGDSLGPVTGTKLKQQLAGLNCYVYGTLSKPITAHANARILYIIEYKRSYTFCYYIRHFENYVKSCCGKKRIIKNSCIGSDLSVGDSLGPVTGTKLKQQLAGLNCYVYIRHFENYVKSCCGKKRIIKNRLLGNNSHNR